MATQSNVSGLDLRENLIINGLVRPEVQEFVIDRSWGYNKMTRLINNLNKGNQSIAKNSDKVFIPYIKSTAISNVTSTNATLSGTVMTITWPTSDTRWRVKDIVMDSNGVQARVIVATANSIQVESADASITLTAGTHFVAGGVSNLGDASGNGASGGKTSLTVVPFQDFAVLAKNRDTYSERPIDREKTEIKYEGKMWYASQQEFVLDRWTRTRELSSIFSTRQYQLNSSIEGQYNRTGGLKWTAQYNGGTYYSVSGVYTESDVQDFIITFAAKKGMSTGVIKMYMGRQALADFQLALKPYILQTGIHNTFGGSSVQGIDTYRYAFVGYTLEVEHYPLFDDPAQFPTVSLRTGKLRSSSFVMAVNTTPATSVNGGSIPAIQRYHHAGLPQIAYRFNEGMALIGPDGLVNEGANFRPAPSDLDVASWQIEEFSGLYFIPECVGFMELDS